MLKPELLQRSPLPRGSPRYRPGSLTDFDRLYRDSYGKLLATMVGMLGRDWAQAEDTVQEAFLKAFGSWRRWVPDAPAEAWVLRIAINLAISQRRKDKLRSAAELVRRLGRPAPQPDPTETVATPLMAALRRLSVHDAALVVLRHHQGYSNRQIAAALRIPESTVSSRLIAAKNRLRTILQTEVDATVSSNGLRVIAQNAEGQR